MPDTKISALTDGSTAVSTDRIPVARSPFASGDNRYITPGYIGTTLLGSGTALTGSTVTTSSPVLNLTQTWNDGAGGAVTFTGLKFNATDTASASGSLLLDLQVGGTSQFKVRKDGYFITNGAGMQIGTAFTVQYTSAQVTVSSGFRLGWGSSDATSSQDLSLTRAAAATLQLGAADAAAPVAQTFKVQSVVGSTPGATDVAGANFTIQGSAGRGNGAGGSIIFQVAPAGSAGTGAQNAYSTALTIQSNSDSVFGSGSGFLPRIEPSDVAFYVGNGVGQYSAALDYNSGLILGSDKFISFSSTTTNANSPGDTRLYRDTSNTLALRNGGTSGTPVPQTFNIYNYYASSTDFERCALKWSSNIFTIGLESNGGFTARELIIASGSGQALRFYAGSTQRWLIDQTGNLLTGAASYDIGSPTANRPGNIYAATSIRATGSTAVIGYGTGAGGAVTQATSRTTGVTLNKGCGQITLVSAAGTTSWQSFTVSNTTVAATDTIIVNQDSGTDLYQIFVTNVAANSFQITFATTGGTTTEQPVFSFAVIKAVAA